MSSCYHLDCDTTPSLSSRNVYAGLEVAKARTFELLESITEGQIGVYGDPRGHKFYGYAIRYAGKPPYFEEAAPETDQ